MIDRHHIYLYEQRKRVTLESRDGTYEPIIGGQVQSLGDGIERLLVFYTYANPSVSEFSQLLQLNIPGITPLDIQKFQEVFKLTHPAEDCNKIELSDVPAYGDKEDGLTIPAAGFVCNMSLEDEQAVLSRLSQNPPEGETVLSQVERWFKSYCYKYNLSYGDGSGQESIDLTDTFLKIHGIDPIVCRRIKRTYTSAEMVEKKKAVAKGKALFFFGIVVWLAVSVGLLIAGNKTDSFIGGGLLLLLGFLLLVWPIIWFIDKGKRE